MAVLTILMTGQPVAKLLTRHRLPHPRRTNRPLTALAMGPTLINEEGRIGRFPRVLTDER